MISILLPTRNEPVAHILVAGIRETMKEISEPYEIVAVDKSDDGTYERLNEMNVTVIRQKSEGLGRALLEGLKAVQGDLVITMDADLSHDPKYIPSFIKKARDSFDVVIGSRRMPGGGVVGWSWRRKLISFGGNFVGRKIAGVNISDLTSGYRLYKTKVLEGIRLDEIKSTGYSFQLEILARSIKKGFKVEAVPIVFRDRLQGRSKLSKRQWLDFLLTALRIRFGGFD